MARFALLLLAVLLGTPLSYWSIRNARAAHQVGLATRAGYESATRLEPQNAENWYLLGRYWQYSLEESDNRRAIQYYRRSLDLNPRSAEAWLDLATADEAEGDVSAAREAFLRARQAYPLSADVSWRYGNFLLRQDDIPQAFAEIRRAVYVEPKRSAEAFSRCWRVAPDVTAILDNVLPPDRNGYLDVIRELGANAQLAAALTVWRRLVALHPALKMREVIAFVDLLLQKREVNDAKRVWDEGLRLSDVSPNLDPRGSVLWDGGFESGVTGGGFAWTLFLPPGVKSSFDSREKHSGRYSLRFSFDGRHNVHLEGACINVAVRPETGYRLSAWIRTQALTTDEGLRLRLTWFPDGHPGSSVDTTDVQGTQPWTLVEIPWIAAKDVHYASVCVVRRQSAKLAGQIQGTAWVDDVALSPDSSSPRP